MKRIVGSLAVVALIAAAAGCSLNATGPVGVTKDASLVAGCENLGDVAVSPNTRSEDVLYALSLKAKAKGANYVLVASDGAREGAAYRCQMPSHATGTGGGASK